MFEEPEAEVLIRHFPSGSKLDVKVDGRWCPVELLLEDALRGSHGHRRQLNEVIRDVAEQSSLLVYLLLVPNGTDR